jgi:hypothetical protein
MNVNSPAEVTTRNDIARDMIASGLYLTLRVPELSDT